MTPQGRRNLKVVIPCIVSIGMMIGLVAYSPTLFRRDTKNIRKQAMHIGTVAERSGVPPKTIRYYESIGLIPAADRQTNGYRTYSDMDMHALSFIRRARRLGFSVEEVRDLLNLWRDRTHTSAAVKAVAVRQLETLDRKIAELRSMRRTLAHLIDRCSGDDRPDCPILDDLGNRTKPRIRARAPAFGI